MTCRFGFCGWVGCANGGAMNNDARRTTDDGRSATGVMLATGSGERALVGRFAVGGWGDDEAMRDAADKGPGDGGRDDRTVGWAVL